MDAATKAGFKQWILDGNFDVKTDLQIHKNNNKMILKIMK